MLKLKNITRFPGIRYLIDGLYRLSWRNAECMFIISTGRTGSSTLINLLNTSSAIKAYHEPKPNLLEEMKASYAEAWEKPERYRRLFTDVRSQLIGHTHLLGKIYIEATQMQFFTPVIADLMHKAKFLHLYRSPWDFVRSAMRRGWYQNHQYDKYRIIPLRTDPARNCWANWGAFEKNCWHWKALNEFFLKFQDSIDKHRTLSISFEQLICPNTRIYEDIFRFLGIEYPAHNVIRRILSVKHNEQKSGSFPRFEDWNEHQRALLQEIAGDVIKKLGYNQDMIL